MLIFMTHSLPAMQKVNANYLCISSLGFLLAPEGLSPNSLAFQGRVRMQSLIQRGRGNPKNGAAIQRGHNNPKRAQQSKVGAASSAPTGNQMTTGTVLDSTPNEVRSGRISPEDLAAMAAKRWHRGPKLFTFPLREGRSLLRGRFQMFWSLISSQPLFFNCLPSVTPFCHRAVTLTSRPNSSCSQRRSVGVPRMAESTACS